MSYDNFKRALLVRAKQMIEVLEQCDKERQEVSHIDLEAEERKGSSLYFYTVDKLSDIKFREQQAVHAVHDILSDYFNEELSYEERHYNQLVELWDMIDEREEEEDEE